MKQKERKDEDPILRRFKDLADDVEHCLDARTNAEYAQVSAIRVFLAKAQESYEKYLEDEQGREQRAREDVAFFDNPGVPVSE